KVLDPKEAKKAFSYGSLNHDSGYLDLESNCYVGGKFKTYGQLLKKQGVEVTVAVDDRGVAHELVKKSEAEKKLKELGIKETGRAVSRKTDRDREKERRVKARKDVLKAVLPIVKTAAKAAVPKFSTAQQKSLMIVVAR